MTSSSTTFLEGDKYHAVFFPRPDVFEFAGPDVFTKLPNPEGKKNAVVLLQSELQKIKEGSHGGSDALNTLSSGKYAHKCEEGAGLVYDYGGNLDVIVSNQAENSLKQHNGKLEILTMDPVQNIEYTSRQFKVSKPEFLMAHSKIVDEGIIEGNDELIAKIFENGKREFDLEGSSRILGRELFPNQFIRFRRSDERRKNLYARIINGNPNGEDAADYNLVKLIEDSEYERKLSIGKMGFKDGILGVYPRDTEQYLACQHGILDQDKELVFVSGAAGTGKTLLSYALGVDLTLHYSPAAAKKRSGLNDPKPAIYDNLVLLKPNDLLGGKGRDIGALPGSLLQKLEPHLIPYQHAHRETVLGKTVPFEQMFYHPKWKNKYGPVRQNFKISEKDIQLNKDQEAIELLFSAHLRGASFSNTLVLIDEAQNFTPYEMQALLTRMGQGSKTVIMGDPDQFDNPKCSRHFNGFTYAIKHFLPKPQSMLIRLPRSYRSQTADDALDMRAYPS